MTTLLLFAALTGSFLLGGVGFGVFLWLWPTDEATNTAALRREEERQLQHLTHAAMVQMLAETRTQRSGDSWTAS